MTEINIDIAKIFFIGFFTFIIAFLMTFPLTHILYKHKLWKKKVKEKAIDGGNIKYFQQFHKEKEIGTPRFGGFIIWTSVAFSSFLFFGLSHLYDFFWLEKLNFLSREQTWLPLFALITASLVGFVDDILQTVNFSKIRLRQEIKIITRLYNRILLHIEDGLRLRYRLILVGAIGAIGAFWFYFQLEQSTIFIPGIGDIGIGILFIPFFIITTIAVYSGGVIDGLDGLSGGVFASIFTAYATIAAFQGQIDLAAFCLAVVGSLLAFLWFNIPPARFYMGETGVIGLTVSLTVVAFLANAVVVLPIIAILLVVTSGSVIIQLLSKKFRNKQVFLAAPIHHHFEAKGWPHYKITMRFWIIGVVATIMGVVIHLLG